MRRLFAGPLAAVLASVLLLATTSLVVSRVRGRFTPPPASAAVFVCGAVVVSLALGARLARADQRSNMLLQAGLSVALLAAAIALSIPGAMRGWLFLWPIVALEEAWAWRRALQSSWRPQRSMARPATPHRLAVYEPVAEMNGERELTQRIIRRDLSNGGEAIEAEAWANFAPGQKTAWIHVAFCPPLPGTPEVSAEPLSVGAARVQAGPIMPHGMRCEVRRTDSAAGRVGVRIRATFPPADQASQ